ncbi:MAG: ABC transporter ATP-binding protein, partial [Erysipelothrix sp.]|nr:ABC transporter ATP-binding protein [Erysipelothrix sp.]
MTQQFLEMRNITKVYPNGVVANENVDLICGKGEIHALMGENGAGKSTLMKILFGIEQPTSGTITFKGEKLNLKSPLDAIDKRIGMVHQHFMLDEDLSVTDNIILGIEPKKGLSLDYEAAKKMVLETSARYQLNVDPDALVMDLDVGKKQKVEILKALIRGAELLIMDEPTAVLTPQETDELFKQFKILRDEGHTIIFISHKLREISSICSRATIMRGGKGLGSYDLVDVSIQELSKMMVGREVVREIDKTQATPGEKKLEVKDLSVVNDELMVVVDKLSLSLHSGEILGIAGVEGNGQRELIDSITGLSTEYSGDIFVNGSPLAKKEPVKQARNLGLFHIPEDRLAYGVIADGSIVDNLISNRFLNPEYSQFGFLDSKKINVLADELISTYQIKTDSKFTPIRMLSGGNMQKVVAAREMSEDISVLIADQPTRGVDVGTASFMHDQLVKIRDGGAAILLVSADINEVM